MTQFVEQQENIQFVEFLPKGKKAREGSYIIKEGETLEGLVETIKDSDTYTKVYTLKVKGVDPSLVITGKKALVDGMGHGSLHVKPVIVGDLVRITFAGLYSTKNGKGYNLKVAVSRSK